jgi:hypothetical protein
VKVAFFQKNRVKSFFSFTKKGPREMMLYCDTLSVEKRYKYWMICSYQEKKIPLEKVILC